MKPVMQTVNSPVNGNCLAACLASILECELPRFTLEDDWMTEVNRWLVARGCALLYTEHVPGFVPLGYHIATVLTPAPHAVVALDGRLVHDPHVSQRGLLFPVSYWYLVVHANVPLCIRAA